MFVAIYILRSLWRTFISLSNGGYSDCLYSFVNKTIVHRVFTSKIIKN